jgi:glycosyltransferase involved in cell wall biosynthesis
MTATPLVSIITPTYNHAKFIAECINSVLTQTYQTWEMIIVDDGSTDDTFSIVQEFAQYDTRIKPFTQKNIGPYRLGETYNFALEVSQGKYIAILEGDDVWEKDKIERQVSVLESNDEIALSWGAAYTIDENSIRSNKINPDISLTKEILENRPIKSIIPHLLLLDFIPAMTIVLRRSVLIKLGGFIQYQGIPSVDHTTLLEAALIGSFHFEKFPLGAWRYYSNQVTKTHAINIYENTTQMALNFYSTHSEVFPYKATFIENHYKHRLVIAYSRSGRYKLIKKDFTGARKDYFHSITHYGLREPIWKIRSLIGLIMSFFHADVEWIAKTLGKMSYK